MGKRSGRESQIERLFDLLSRRGSPTRRTRASGSHRQIDREGQSACTVALEACASLPEESEHPEVLAKDQAFEAVYPHVAGPLREGPKHDGPEPAILEFVDYRHGDLGGCRVVETEISGDGDESLRVTIRGDGGPGEAVHQVEIGEPVEVPRLKLLKRGEEPVIARRARERFKGGLQQWPVCGDEGPDGQTRSVIEVDRKDVVRVHGSPLPVPSHIGRSP